MAQSIANVTFNRASDSFLDAIFNNNTAFGPAGTTLDAWCIRYLQPLELDNGFQYQGYLYSSYETSLLGDSTFSKVVVDNLDNVNWLLNYYRRGDDPSLTMENVQWSIWELMNQVDSRSTLTRLALLNDGYVPEVGETLAVIVDPVRPDGTHDQTSIVETKAAGLGDRVWYDKDLDGIQDADETGIGGAKVELVRDINGDGQITGNEVLATTQTDGNGNYIFKGLTPGLDYQVRFTTPDGYEEASPRQSDGSSTSGTNSDGSLSNVVVLAPGEYNPTLDAGFGHVPKPTTTTNPDAAVACEDRAVTFNVLKNDIGEGLTLVGVRHESSTLDTAFNKAGGWITFKADGTVTYDTMTDYYGKDKLVYTVQDAQGNRYDQTVDLTVKAVSDAPVATGGDSSVARYISTDHYEYVFKSYDFKIDDSKDIRQSFSATNYATAHDTDTLKSITIYGITKSGGDIYYNGRLVGSGGVTVSLGDIDSGRLKFVGTQQDSTFSYKWAATDTGSVINDACYNGSVTSSTVTGSVKVSPIALDLNGDGHIGVTGATSSADKDPHAAIGQTVRFDIDADGKLDTIEWYDGSGDGILIDNRDGLAATQMDGSRLFGDHGGAFEHGYAQLATLDANRDGQLFASELSGLMLWVDNGDAIVQDGELQSLSQHGIEAISTQIDRVIDDSGKELLQSTATRADGSAVLTEDVYFVQDVSNVGGDAPSAAAAPALHDLLDAGSLDEVVGASAASTQVAQVPADVADVSQAAEILRKLSAALDAHAVAA